MIRRSLARRRLEQSFAVAVALLVVVLMGTTMLVVHTRVAYNLRTGLESRGLSMARSIGAVAQPSLLAYNYAALQIAAEGAAAGRDVMYVVIHDKEGNVAGAAGALPRGGVHQPPGGLPLQDPKVFESRFETQSGKEADVLEVAAPVFVEGAQRPWGTVRVGLSYSPVVSELRRIDLGLLVLGLMLAGAAVASGRWMARRITAPLRDLVAGTEALSKGDMTHRIPVGGPREIADLAQAFNTMMDRIQEKAVESREFQEALEDLNATLEQQVLDRTRALQESEAQYKTLVEHSPDAIMIVQEGRVRFINRAFLDTFGYDEAHVLSAEFDLDDIFEPSSATLARGRIHAWEQGEPMTPADILGRDRSGAVRHLELRGSRIEYRGRPAAECLLIDMTEAQRLRDKLAETERLRSLGELAGGVAHDFNNLLSAILGRVQLLRKRRRLAQDVARSLEIIEKAALDGRETVRRIQEFSRTRRDREFSAVDLTEVIQDSVEMTRPRWHSAEGPSIRIRTEVFGECKVVGNAAELREVFTNLILNAVDAMPEGGEIELRCRRRRRSVEAQVRDTGHGMSDETRRHLFDPFFTTKGHSGTGLGMSVVYGIVTRHEGEIEVHSRMGEGTRFVLRFPPAPAGLEVEGGDGAAMPQLVRPGKILVVDDEPEVAELVRDALIMEGHEVTLALSGSEALAHVRKRTFDLVLTDLGMPDMSGWEVTENVRKLRADLRVVLVTGWGASLDEAEARRRGVSGVIHKPFELDELVRVTARMLGGSGGDA